MHFIVPGYRHDVMYSHRLTSRDAFGAVALLAKHIERACWLPRFPTHVIIAMDMSVGLTLVCILLLMHRMLVCAVSGEFDPSCLVMPLCRC